MYGRLAISMLAATLACRSSERVPAATQGSGSGSGSAAPQSPRDAMAIACTVEEAAQLATLPPEQRGAAAMTWLRAHVTSAEILHVLDEAALDTWPSARARLVALAGQHGLTSCALANAAKGPAYPVKLPPLAGPSRPWTEEPAVVVSDASIAYAGTPVVELDHGRIAKTEVAGHRVRKLVAALAAATHGERVQIVADAATPMETLVPVIASLATGDVAKVSIVCEQNHEAVLLDVDMPLGSVAASFALIVRPSTLQLAHWARGKVGAPIAEASLDGGLGQIMRALLEQVASGSAAADRSAPIVLVADGSLDTGHVVGLVGALGSMSTRVVLSPDHP